MVIDPKWYLSFIHIYALVVDIIIPLIGVYFRAGVV
jgi:hypothetical protein